MNENPISTRPRSRSEELLLEKFVESMANQSEQMDRLGQQLIALELAIPGLYATVIKLTAGNKAMFSTDSTLWFTFACWFLSLLITLFSLIPRKWKVNVRIMKQGPASKAKELGIEDFFHKTAQYKRRLIIAASMLFFIGVLSAAFTIF